MGRRIQGGHQHHKALLRAANEVFSTMRSWKAVRFMWSISGARDDVPGSPEAVFSRVTELIAGNDNPSRGILVDAPLIIRGSTAPPAQ
jgi:hypothetical protein